MTHRASNFTEGVLEMERTVLGIIQVDARQILHDGLRKELVRQVSRAMHATLVFVNPKTNTASSSQVDVRSDLDRCLKKLGKVMDGFRRSVEYLQVCDDECRKKGCFMHASKRLLYTLVANTKRSKVFFLFHLRNLPSASFPREPR